MRIYFKIVQFGYSINADVQLNFGICCQRTSCKRTLLKFTDWQVFEGMSDAYPDIWLLEVLSSMCSNSDFRKFPVNGIASERFIIFMDVYGKSSKRVWTFEQNNFFFFEKWSLLAFFYLWGKLNFSPPAWITDRAFSASVKYLFHCVFLLMN